MNTDIVNTLRAKNDIVDCAATLIGHFKAVDQSKHNDRLEQNENTLRNIIFLCAVLIRHEQVLCAGYRQLEQI